MALTDTGIKALKSKEKLYRQVDADRLYIQVSPKGLKTWYARFDLEQGSSKKSDSISFGRYGNNPNEISLKQARDMNRNIQKLAARGINPKLYKSLLHEADILSAIEKSVQDEIAKQELEAKSNVLTFNELFLLWHKHNSETWSYAHARDIRERIDKHLIPQIGSMALDDIKPMDVIKALKIIEQGGRVETTRRVKQYANRIFKFGIGFGHCERNPASELPDDIFKKAEKSNYAHTTDPKVLTQILNAIDEYAGDIVTKKALELAPYVFLRSKELAGLEWSEVDFDNGVIEIPAERMKKKRVHLVPISSKVKEILDYMQPLSGDSKYIFPSPRTKSRPIGEQTLNPALHRLGFKNIQTFHGFRHTASTMLNEMGFMGDIIEKQLAHEEINKVRGAYNKAQYIEQRKEMMQEWAKFLNGLKRQGKLLMFERFN
ncbi:MAG: tyrosine-type recombinase/integrase [Thiomicrorhabdus chilensis]|uniref:tyrosine-type recombinase/integrase n=1 Tax=Thiomicrorhabdus chilensis TaxID=63656 RepID=UPI00299F1A60|nr:tyrosine-type recombinase/integrase [Thiomicrorhabdus chilensis]MDX1346965.1 tyrosine-type recombinase/integrase [Thiomicrorhabdus chilensis]